MNLSLKDIANALNVSKTTVSWVLAGQGNERKISMVTQEKIIAYAKKVNYQPNLLAKSLISGASHTLGLVIPYIGDEFYAQIAQVIEAEAEKYDYTLTFSSSESNQQRESKIIQMLKSKQVDGLIIAPTRYSKKEIEVLLDEKFPFVLIDRYFPELDTNYVVLDNEESSFKLVNKMIRRGKKRIALITTDTNLFVMNSRRKGYEKALKEAHLPVLPELYGEVKRGEYVTDIIKVLDRIFETTPDVDGFYFTTHYLGMEALRYFYKRGINISTKVELACLHSTPCFEILAPQMHIAEQPVQKIGQQAVQILMNELEGKTNENIKAKITLSAIMDFN